MPLCASLVNFPGSVAPNLINSDLSFVSVFGFVFKLL